MQRGLVSKNACASVRRHGNFAAPRLEQNQQQKIRLHGRFSEYSLLFATAIPFIYFFWPSTVHRSSFCRAARSGAATRSYPAHEQSEAGKRAGSRCVREFHHCAAPELRAPLKCTPYSEEMYLCDVPSGLRNYNSPGPGEARTSGSPIITGQYFFKRGFSEKCYSFSVGFFF